MTPTRINIHTDSRRIGGDWKIYATIIFPIFVLGLIILSASVVFAQDSPTATPTGEATASPTSEATATPEAAASNAKAPPACDNTILTCGCRINKQGVYTVGANLSSTQGLTPSGNCIEITAKYVILNLAGNEIAGSGDASSNFGVSVHRGANNVTIAGTRQFAFLSGWNVGLYTAATGGTFTNIDASNNQNVGIEIDLGGSRNNLTAWGASNEAGAGIGLWIRRGGGNYVIHGIASSDHDGILVGCGNAATSDNVSCKGAATVDNNKFNDVINNETSNNGRYGIVLDNNVRQSVVTGNIANSNISDDLFDGSANCGTNNWLDNVFTSANLGCIQ